MLCNLFLRRGGGKAPYLNVNQLVNFLNQEQRDPRLNEILYPYYNKEKALSLIWKYEKSLDNLQRGIILNRIGTSLSMYPYLAKLVLPMMTFCACVALSCENEA